MTDAILGGGGERENRSSNDLSNLQFIVDFSLHFQKTMRTLQIE